jgi:hypothetical protein
MKKDNETIYLSKHTKDVWAVTEDSKAIIADFPNEICRINHNLKEYKANAQLIVKAVNNYDALVVVLKKYIDVLENNRNPIGISLFKSPMYKKDHSEAKQLLEQLK